MPRGRVGGGRGDHDRWDEDRARTRRGTRTAPTRSWSREILKEAEETDRREDELYGEERGDELPEQLRTAEGRRAAFEAAKERLAQEGGP